MKRTKKFSTMRPTHGIKTNKTFWILHTICKIIYLCTATNFWFDDFGYPNFFMTIYNSTSKVLEVIVVVFIISECGSFYTQHSLTEKQSNDRILYSFSHVSMFSVYVSIVYYKREVKKLVEVLAVELKEICNYESIEKMMVKTVVRCMIALYFMCCAALLSHGIRNGLQALTSNSTFTTIIPVWPEVEDRRLIAGVARIVYYILWCIFAIRVVSAYIMVLTSTVSLAYQFKNLCKYFEDLNEIFEGSGSQEEKERRYEAAFKVGIKMHSKTLWCTRQLQLAGGLAFSGQVILNVSCLVMLMMQMTSAERTLAAVMPIFTMAASMVVATGMFLCNAGDVTIEASKLPAAVFHSGWHNCTKQSSFRVRKLVTISITQAQKRVLLKGLGFIELSYESFVTIVKSSYSVFSVIY